MKLGFAEACVEAAFGDKFVVLADFHDAAFVHYDDAIGVDDGREAVGNDECSAISDKAIHCFLNKGFGFGIER